ncbi:MAG: ABC transporter permease [Candidatus Thorarchaeota archaeon]|nr:ABC transporter permease [Candidatus Thorarchaeota archaeon]
MRLRDTLGYAGGAIRLRKLRSGLTTLGIVIGIAAIVALLSFTQGFQVAINGQFQEGLSTDVVTVSPGNGGFGGLGFGGGDSDFVFYENDTDRIDALDGVVISSATVSKTVTAEFELMDRMLSLTGVDFATYEELYATFTTVLGEVPAAPADGDVIIGYYLYDPWDNGTHLVELGDEINVYYSVRNGTVLQPVNLTVTVVGIMEEIGSFGFGPSDSGMYLSINSALNYFDTEEVNSIDVKLESDDQDFIAAVSDDIEALFLNEVSVTSATALLGTITSVLGIVDLLLAGIGGISLLVAGIGIMNIMIVSLMERTREIGILKALGAKGTTVLGIFLAEALLIGLLGGVFGIGLGAFLANLFGGMLNGFGGMGGGDAAAAMSIAPVVTPLLALQAMVFGIGVSVLFALWPAYRASKLMPVDALRSE